MRADDVRHNRFLMRLMSRNPDNFALGILNGHNCLVAGTYKYSLGEYMMAFKQAGFLLRLIFCCCFSCSFKEVTSSTFRR